MGALELSGGHKREGLKYPIIQRCGNYFHIGNDCYKRDSKGEAKPISTGEYERACKGKEVGTWDPFVV